MSDRLAAIAALGVLALCGCNGDRVVGRYRSALCEDARGPGPPVQVPCDTVQSGAVAFAQSFATPGGGSGASVTGFSDRGQAAYIDALARSQKDPAALAAALAAPIAGAATSGPLDRTTFHRTIVVTVRRDGGFNPSDRLEATDVVIHLPDARFDSWDTIATATTTINAGQVQLQQTHGLTETLSAGTPSAAPASASLAIGGSQQQQRTETLSAGGQVETLTATVEGDQGRDLRIRRQGGYGLDLTGNTVIKVDISWQPAQGSANAERFYLFSANIRDAQGKPLPLSKASLVPTAAVGLIPGTAIKAEVSLTYTMRHVIRGGDTYEERDDDVLERTASARPQKVELVPARDASPGSFALLLAGSDETVLAWLPDRRRAVPLCFDTPEAAQDLLGYLRRSGGAHPGRVGGTIIGVAGIPGVPPEPLTAGQLAQADVRSGCLGGAR